jgi:outer membrane biogenesis lipoprotein LolB
LRAARRLVLLFLGCALLCTAGCGVSSSRQQAAAAIDAFHNELNAGDFDAIWDGADDQFRQAGSRQSYEKFVDAVHRKLGRALRTSNQNWSVRTLNLQTSIVLVQHTEFEYGKGTETFTFSVRRDSVKLVGYHIESMELVTL